MKTYKDAAKTLPFGCRKAFEDAWEAIGSMDLYDGELKAYFQIIEQRFLQLQRCNTRMKEELKEISEKALSVAENHKVEHKESSIAEAHAPMNVACSKCGKIYCDHENKY